MFTHRTVVIGKEARVMIEREFLKDKDFVLNPKIQSPCQIGKMYNILF